MCYALKIHFCFVMSLMRHFGGCQLMRACWMVVSFHKCLISVCCVLNINRAEKCPEWNEFVAAWSLCFLMMVMSRGERKAILCCVVQQRNSWLFGTALFSAQFQCLVWAGACDLAMNLHSYELAEVQPGLSCEYLLRCTAFILPHLKKIRG